MAIKQNGVLSTFTPTTSKYTNNTVAAPGTVAATGWNMYTCPAQTLVSGKLIVSNNTGGKISAREIVLTDPTSGATVTLDSLSGSGVSRGRVYFLSN